MPPTDTLATVIDLIERMDLQGLRDFLPNDIVLQEYDKEEFLTRIKRCFDELKDNGNDCLVAVPGRCSGGCKEYREGYCFVGNYNQHYMPLIIEVQSGVLKDIHDCTRFECFTKLVRLNCSVCIDPDHELTILANNNHD